MAETFTHMIDYVKDEDKTFDERPFDVADSMVLSELAYLRFERVVRKPSIISLAMPISAIAISERLAILLDGVRDRDKLFELVHAVAASRRFGDMKVNFAEGRFSEEKENQFAAVTYFLADKSVFVAFRGTDNTITGWRENFNMAYKPFVPAQSDSVEYLNKVALITRNELRVGGHSKGGNLAIYASVNCNPKTQDRILAVYSLDGPGFKRSIFEDTEFLRIKNRVNKIVPQGTMIGTLLNQTKNYRVVESDGEGFEQHSLYNWRFSGEKLVYTEKLTDDAVRFDHMVDSWLDRLTDVQLEGTVETLFRIIDDMEAKSFDDVLKTIENGDVNAVKAYRLIEPDKRAQAINIITALGKAFISSRKLPKSENKSS